MDTEPAASAVLEIDLAAIAANWRALRARHAGAVGAVVKADGYGLGAATTAPALHAAGCRHFFTAHLAEAIALRPLLPGAMIAALNGPLPGEEEAYRAHDIHPVLGSLGQVAAWSGFAARRGRRLPVLLHVDTGMSRLGLGPDELATLAAEPARLDGLDLRYVMTHLAAAERPQAESNARQLARFRAACAALPAAPTSLANSSALFLGPGYGSDLARPGAALWGINPTPGRANPMRPGLRLSVRVLQVRAIAAGEGVGYNASFTAARPSRIATVAWGYADGFHRAFSNRARAFFDGEPLRLVGTVSMDLATFDATDHPLLGPGDWLELVGPHQSADELAGQAGLSPYELLTSLGRRAARRVRGAE
ncbi:MAG: alanine racemase [Acetobacteraceae bacterium]